MFKSSESKLAVLESKLNIYEDLSREMLSKLESAVEKISEGNSRIANILAKHDERIEQATKSDELLIKIVDNVKRENKEDHKFVIERINNLETKVDNLVKFRWQAGGVLTVLVVLIAVLDVVAPSFKNVFSGRETVIENIRK